MAGRAWCIIIYDIFSSYFSNGGWGVLDWRLEGFSGLRLRCVRCLRRVLGCARY